MTRAELFQMVRVPGDTELDLAIDWVTRTAVLLSGSQRLSTIVPAEIGPLCCALQQAEWELEGAAGAQTFAPVTCDVQGGVIFYAGATFTAVQSQALRRLLSLAETILETGVGSLADQA